MRWQHMAYSDQQIIPIIRRLAEEKKPLTATAISAECEVPLRTVQRCIERLEKNRVIRRTGAGRRWGSVYEFLQEP